MNTNSQTASAVEKRTNARYWIVVMLFIVTSFNYGDRATLSIAGSEMAKDIGLDPIGMGNVFSAFSWAYVIGQIPGGWSHVFFFMGGLGVIISFVWLKVIHEPNNHPGVNKKELEYIEEGGALIHMDQKKAKEHVPFAQKWGQIKQLLGSRMMIGIYIGQYCINALPTSLLPGSLSTWCRKKACRFSRRALWPRCQRCVDLSAACWAG
jgi:hypothetical protein